jgi:hypothetical protein
MRKRTRMLKNLKIIVMINSKILSIKLCYGLEEELNEILTKINSENSDYIYNKPNGVMIIYKNRTLHLYNIKISRQLLKFKII